MNRYVQLGIVGLAAGGIGGTAAGWIVGGRPDSATVTALATVVLVVITAYYAFETYRSRQQQEQLWLREVEHRRVAARQARSRDAARPILAKLHEVDILTAARPTDRDTEIRGYLELPRVMDAYGFELDDEELKDRVRTARIVTSTLGHDPSEFEKPDGSDGTGFAVLLTRYCLSQTRGALEAHVAGRPLPGWYEMPASSVSALAWLIDSARSGVNTAAESH